MSLFGQCDDGKVEALSDALQATVAKWKARIPTPVPLELYTSSTFIGLFVEEQVAELLKGFAADFASEAEAKAGSSHHRMHVQTVSVPSVDIFVSSVQTFMSSLIKSSFMSLWRTTSTLVTFQFWRSWPKMWTCAPAATGWLCSIQETSASLTMRSLFLSFLLTKWV